MTSISELNHALSVVRKYGEEHGIASTVDKVDSIKTEIGLGNTGTPDLLAVFDERFAGELGQVFRAISSYGFDYMTRTKHDTCARTTSFTADVYLTGKSHSAPMLDTLGRIMSSYGYVRTVTAGPGYTHPTWTRDYGHITCTVMAIV